MTPIALYVVYIIFLWTVTQIQGESPYPVFTFDSGVSYAKVLGLLPAICFAYFCNFGLTLLKFKLLKDGGIAKEETSEVEFNEIDTGL